MNLYKRTQISLLCTSVMFSDVHEAWYLKNASLYRMKPLKEIQIEFLRDYRMKLRNSLRFKSENGNTMFQCFEMGDTDEFSWFQESAFKYFCHCMKLFDKNFGYQC